MCEPLARPEVCTEGALCMLATLQWDWGQLDVGDGPWWASLLVEVSGTEREPSCILYQNALLPVADANASFAMLRDDNVKVRCDANHVSL